MITILRMMIDSPQKPYIHITLNDDDDFPFIISFVGMYDTAYLMSQTENDGVYISNDGIKLIINNNNNYSVIDENENAYNLPIVIE